MPIIFTNVIIRSDKQQIQSTAVEEMLKTFEDQLNTLKRELEDLKEMLVEMEVHV